MSNETNPYKEWLKQMPPENREFFLESRFEEYLLAWRAKDSTEKLMEKEVNKRIELLMDTKEFKAKIKEQLNKTLAGFRGDDVVSRLTTELVEKLKDAENY